MAIHTRRYGRQALLLGLTLLAGCSGVLESRKPVRQVFLLQPPQPPAVSAGEASGVTLVLAVTAVPGLDTDRILVLGRDARLNPVANAHWADHLPEVFTSVTRRALAGSERFGRVSIGTIARPDEWLLDVELQEFYGVQDAAGRTAAVRLRIDAALRCGTIRQRLTLQESTPASQASLADLVAAHQYVLDVVLNELPGRIASSCSG